MLLPLLSVVIWLASAIGNAQLAQMANLTAAATIVRGAQLGYPQHDLDALATTLGVSFKVTNYPEGLICIEAGSNRGDVLFASDARQRSCSVVPAN